MTAAWSSRRTSYCQPLPTKEACLSPVIFWMAASCSRVSTGAAGSISVEAPSFSSSMAG